MMSQRVALLKDCILLHSNETLLLLFSLITYTFLMFLLSGCFIREFHNVYTQHPNVLAAQTVIARKADSPYMSIISHLFMFFPVRQIECSSISEYSERIIKSNHLDSGKICSCLCSPHSDVSVPYPADKHGLEDEGGGDGRTPLPTETSRTGGTHHSILKCTI